MCTTQLQSEIGNLHLATSRLFTFVWATTGISATRVTHRGPRLSALCATSQLTRWSLTSVGSVALLGLICVPSTLTLWSVVSGAGNGKYMGLNPSIRVIGSDISDKCALKLCC
jgi:hypothetical protein